MSVVNNKKRSLDMSVDDLLRKQELSDSRVKRQKVIQSSRKASEFEDTEDEESQMGMSDEEEEEDMEGNLKSEGLEEDRSDEEDSDELSGSSHEDGSENGTNAETSTTAGLQVQDRLGLLVKKQTNISKPKTNSTVTKSFASFGIAPALLGALESMSIKLPTEIQTLCVPPLIAGRDCIGNAKTGSGKTIAFALPILQKLSVDPYGIYALVITPTRELAFQIAEQFAVLGAGLSVRTAVIVGGMDMMTQALELEQRPHVVIATPGRIVDHLRSTSGTWNLSRVRFLVLDEADRLLTPTFAPELTHLFSVLPKERQTCLFTATWTPAIDAVADAQPKPGKQKPYIHRMTETVETVSTLKQYYILVPSHVRESYLFHLLCNPPESTLHLRRAPPEQVKNLKNTQHKPRNKAKTKNNKEELEQPPPTIIFCAKPKTAAYLTHFLQTLSIRSTALHSWLTQRERLSSLSLFKASVIPVLISTDVGARGLDIEDVAMVINWDLPNEAEEYTHRVGRTARAGKGGVAFSFVTERDEERILSIENRIKTKLEDAELPEDKVLEHLNAVSTAKRLASMELHDSKFGKREEIYKIKKAKLGQGMNDAAV